MTKTWARELGKKGILVNVVAPGFILTEMTTKMPEKILDMMRQKCPLNRHGTPEGIAGVYPVSSLGRCELHPWRSDQCGWRHSALTYVKNKIHNHEGVVVWATSKKHGIYY